MCLYVVKMRGVRICGRSVYATDKGIKVGWTGPQVSLEEASSSLSPALFDVISGMWDVIASDHDQHLRHPQTPSLSDALDNLATTGVTVLPNLVPNPYEEGYENGSTTARSLDAIGLSDAPLPSEPEWWTGMPAAYDSDKLAKHQYTRGCIDGFLVTRESIASGKTERPAVEN